MFRLLLLLLLTIQLHCRAEEGSIIFIHIGDTLPTYLETACQQVRRFNPDIPLIVAANRSALDNKPSVDKATWIVLEDLPISNEHRRFNKSTPLGKGFWRYTSERFLYLYDILKHFNLKHVFHLENDNMLYTNLKRALPIFKRNYPGMAATFDSDNRCIAGFMYIRDAQSLQPLASYFADQASLGVKTNDMLLIADFKNRSKPSVIDYLPIIPSAYIEDHPLISPHGHLGTNPENYCNHFGQFHLVFDAAALGQYLGSKKFINESCVFNPSFFKYKWMKDGRGRWVPHLVYKKKAYRINNLHIHSKALHEFKS